MEIKLGQEDIQTITEDIITKLKPCLFNQKEEETIFDKKSLSKYIKVDVSWIDKNMHCLPHFKLGKYVRFRKKDIDNYIESKNKMPSPYLSLLRN